MINDNHKLIIKGVMLTIVLLALPLFFEYVMAQPPAGGPPGGTGDGSPPPDCWTPDCIPIDGGLSLLIAAGAALGGKKIYDQVK